MPRMKPTQVIEQRISLSNWERKWIEEQENYLKTRVNVAMVGVALIPVAAIGGLGLLGYGIYRGLNSFSFGDAKTIVKGAGEDYFDWVIENHLFTRVGRAINNAFS